MSLCLNTKPCNILLVIADDLRPVLGCYGHPQVKTPNIDSLASRGTVFRQAYCNVPVSGASRASLLTGLYPDFPQRFSHFDAWAQKDAPDAVPISEWFRRNGFTTWSFGKVFHNLRDWDSSWTEYPWRLNPEGYGKDWADYNKWELWLNEESAAYVNPKTRRGPFCEASDRPDEDYDDGQVARHAAARLDSLAASGERFFMAVGFWRPHLPFNAPRKYWDMYDRDSIVIADNRFRPKDLPKQVTGSGEIRGYGLVGDTGTDEFHALARHGYYACVSFVDAQVGIVLDELERTGLAENTVVIFIGDHGWHLGEHNYWGKHNLLQNAIGAPLIIASPTGKGRQSDGVTEFVDLYPTMCDYAGLDLPGDLDGQSLKKVVETGRYRARKYAFVHWNDGISVEDGRFNYAAWFDKEGRQVAEMLFDHRTDPKENVNVVADSGYRKALSRLRKALESHR